MRTHSFCAERILELGLEEVRFEGLFEGRDPTMRSRGSNGTLPFASRASRSVVNLADAVTACRPFKKSNSSSSSLFSTTRPTQPTPAAKPVIPSPLPPQDTPPQTPITPVLSATSPPFLPSPPVPSKELGLSIPSTPPISRQPSYSSVVSLPSTSSSTSKLVPSYDFRPLLRLMLHELASSPPCSRPLRSFVGEVLSKITSPPFDVRGGAFKDYCEAAVKEGLVRVGRGTIIGQDWIELAVTVKEAKSVLYVSRMRFSSSVANRADSSLCLAGRSFVFVEQGRFVPFARYCC